jgi:fructokinase
LIVVCGEALIDVIHNGDGTERAVPGGGPFNTARALARLGVPTSFLGHLSDDPFGRELAELLKSDGANLDLATFGPERTTMAMADVDSEGLAEYQFVVQGTSAPQLTVSMLPDRLSPEVNALHLGTLGMVLEPMASTLVEFIHRERAARVVMLDPNVRAGLIPDDVYRERLRDAVSRSTIVKASEDDLVWMFPGVGYRDAAEQLLASGVRLVVVTLGSAGSFAAHRDLRFSVEAVPVDLVDTIGAGDAFGAALLAWLHDNGHLEQDLTLKSDELLAALQYACAAAAITCSRAGAEPPWKHEMQ